MCNSSANNEAVRDQYQEQQRAQEFHQHRFDIVFTSPPVDREENMVEDW
jgi:hypothetical protein